MREVSTESGKFKIRESIKELPIHRYSEFQKYLLQDSGIGSTIEDVYRHFEKTDIFIAAGKMHEAAQERMNQHYNFYMMLNKISITDCAFCCLVDEVDGIKVTDYSESNLKAIGKLIGESGLQRGELDSILTEVKKNLIPS